jgi:hypothetical protein
MKYFKARWNYGAAGMILLVISIIQGWRFGYDILQELDDGCAFILGGPSLWYATALFPTIVGVGYLISWLLSVGNIEYTTGQSSVKISEKKLLRTQRLRLSRNEIDFISFSNTKLGWENVGLVLLVLSSYWLAIDAFTMLNYHAAFGLGIISARFYLLQVIANVCAIILILFFGPGKVLIRGEILGSVEFEFPLLLDAIRRTGRYNLLKKDFNLIALRIPKSLQRHLVVILLYGLLLFVVSITSRIFNVFSNEPLRILYIVVGVWCFAYSVKNLFPDGKKWLWKSANNKGKIKITISKSPLVLVGFTLFCTCLTVIFNLVNLPKSPVLLRLIISNIGYGGLVLLGGILVLVPWEKFLHKYRQYLIHPD